MDVRTAFLFCFKFKKKLKWGENTGLLQHFVLIARLEH
jgi:hypothetical protein